MPPGVQAAFEETDFTPAQIALSFLSPDCAPVTILTSQQPLSTGRVIKC
jgi:hypothetical protein